MTTATQLAKQNYGTFENAKKTDLKRKISVSLGY